MERLKEIHKVCVLGDSVLRGVIYDMTVGRYTFSKKRAISTFEKEHDITVIDYSKFGCTVDKGLKKLNTALEKKVDFEGLLIEFGGNDCDYNWDLVAADPTGHHEMNTSYPMFVSTMREIVETALAAGKRPFIMNLPPIDYERYFRWIAKGDEKRADNLMRFLKDKSIIYRNQERFSRTAERIAREYGLYIIDVREPMLGIFNFQEYLCIDGIHPNEKGQKVIEECFERYYQRLFGQDGK